MNANFKGVAIILSDKSADDIWKKIGLIDDKDAEQDRKNEEQDEAIAGKLDKDDGMGLVDEKLGGIDNAIESLTEELNDLTEDVDDNVKGDIDTIINNLSALSDKLDAVISNTSKYEETVLWEGIADDVDDEVELDVFATNYDYIDIYYNSTPQESCGILTVSSDKFVSETITINYLGFGNGLSDQYYLSLQSVGGSETTFKIISCGMWKWDGDHTHDAEYDDGVTNMTIYKVVGRKMTPLSDIITEE